MFKNFVTENEMTINLSDRNENVKKRVWKQLKKEGNIFSNGKILELYVKWKVEVNLVDDIN